MHILLGGRGGRIFCWENFQWREKFPGGELFSVNFTLGDFARIPVRTSYVLLSLYRFNFTCAGVKVNLLLF